jgi:hypothetical protein
VRFDGNGFIQADPDVEVYNFADDAAFQPNVGRKIMPQHRHHQSFCDFDLCLVTLIEILRGVILTSLHKRIVVVESS